MRVKLITFFCIFTLFSDGRNDSCIIELTCLVNSGEYHKYSDKILVLFPKNYNSSMLIGFISKYRLNIYSYDDFSELCKYCYTYIKRNLPQKFK